MPRSPDHRTKPLDLDCDVGQPLRRDAGGAGRLHQACARRGRAFFRSHLNVSASASRVCPLLWSGIALMRISGARLERLDTEGRRKFGRRRWDRCQQSPTAMRLVARPDPMNQNAKIADVAWIVNSRLDPEIAGRVVFGGVRDRDLLWAIRELILGLGRVLVEPVVQTVSLSAVAAKQNPRRRGGSAGDAELMVRPNEISFGVVEPVTA